MQKNVNPVDKNSPEYLTKQVAGGRYSLLLILIFTTINLVLLLTDAGRYFLFSASVPYYLTAFGIGMDYALGGTTYTYTALVISAVILVVYLLCYLQSKNRTGWLTAALVLFCIDTVGLIFFSFTLLDSPMENILDFLLHGWAVVELIQAVRCAGKLKQLAAQQIPQPQYTGYNGDPEIR